MDKKKSRAISGVAIGLGGIIAAVVMSSRSFVRKKEQEQQNVLEKDWQRWQKK